MTTPAQSDLRQQMRASARLKLAGLFPGQTGINVADEIADSLFAVVQPLLDQQRAAGMREAAAMLRRYCPNHGPDDAAITSMDCHCEGADEIDRDANAVSAAAPSATT